MEGATATTIGLGVPSARQYVGLYYVSHGVAHTSQLDSCIQTETDRVPVVREEDGKLIAVESSPDHYDQEVTICQRCAMLDGMSFDWHDEAACYGVADDRFFDPARANEAIAEYCDHCPVIRDCLEAGALLDKQNASTVWGGVYFRKQRAQRLEAINAQRTRLAHRTPPVA